MIKKDLVSITLGVLVLNEKKLQKSESKTKWRTLEKHVNLNFNREQRQRFDHTHILRKLPRINGPQWLDLPLCQIRLKVN